jgi:hypothetical protein
VIIGTTSISTVSISTVSISTASISTVSITTASITTASITTASDHHSVDQRHGVDRHQRRGCQRPGTGPGRSYTEIAGSIQTGRTAAPRGRHGERGRSHIQSTAHPAVDSHKDTVTTTTPEIVGPAGSDAGESAPQQNDPIRDSSTATAEHLKRLWEAGARNITVTYDDDDALRHRNYLAHPRTDT